MRKRLELEGTVFFRKVNHNKLKQRRMNMEKLEEIKLKLAELKPILKERFKVKTIGVFGSYIRGRKKEKSDLDILVEFEEPISLLKFIALENYLSDSIGVKVDLVEKSTLKPRIGKHILKEVVNI